jgi:hypothetical protein
VGERKGRQTDQHEEREIWDWCSHRKNASTAETKSGYSLAPARIIGNLNDGSPLLLSQSLGHPLTPQDQLALKFDLDCCVYFDGPALERSGLVAPLADGVYCGFGKNWVAINHCDFADAAVHSENYVK